MSLQPQPQQQPVALGGWLTKLKPWQMLLIFLVLTMAALMLPTLRSMFSKPRISEANASVSSNQNVGTGWREPVFPPIDVEKVALTKPMDTPKTPEIARTPPIAEVKPMTIMPQAKPLEDQRMFGQRETVPPAAAANGAGAQQASADGSTSALGGLLKPTSLSGYKATRMTKQWATIEQGRIIPCTTDNSMTSQLPGFVRAVLPNTVYSFDGTTPLLEAGSVVFGEISHGLIQGQNRLFVLWRQVTTPAPNGVRITLNSPAADEMGEAGLPGDVDHHVWQKIGGALMLSLVQTALQTASGMLQNSTQHNGNGSNNGNLNYYQLQGQGSSLASDLLRSQITIPDTLHRDQALACSIFVSGDLVFDDVYALRLRR